MKGANIVKNLRSFTFTIANRLNYIDVVSSEQPGFSNAQDIDATLCHPRYLQTDSVVVFALFISGKSRTGSSRCEHHRCVSNRI